VARQLVPLDDLEAAMVRWIEIDEPVTATLVAEAAGVYGALDMTSTRTWRRDEVRSRDRSPYCLYL
jgi:hypothetical protein